MKPFVTIKSFSSRLSADVAQSVLESQDVEAILVATEGSVELKVPLEDIELAQELLNSYLN